MASGLLLMSTNALSGSENAALSSKLTVRTVYILSLIHISEIRYLRELQEADDLREDDMETACLNLGLDLDYREYFMFLFLFLRPRPSYIETARSTKSLRLSSESSR